MSSKNQSDDITGSRIDVPKKGKVFPWLANRMGLTRLVHVANAMLGIQVQVPFDLGGQVVWQNARVDWGKNGLIIRLPAASGVGIPANSSGGGANIGDYDTSETVSAGWIRRVSPLNSRAVTQGGDIVPGVYFAKLPSQGVPPIHPLSSGGESAYWGWLSTWPTQLMGCDETGNPIPIYTDAQNPDPPAP